MTVESAVTAAMLMAVTTPLVTAAASLDGQVRHNGCCFSQCRVMIIIFCFKN